MSTSHHGTVVSVRGRVVDVRVDERLPPVHSLLRAGEDGRIVLDVLAQRDGRHARGVALIPTHGFARGSAVEDIGGPLRLAAILLQGQRGIRPPVARCAGSPAGSR